MMNYIKQFLFLCLILLASCKSSQDIVEIGGPIIQYESSTLLTEVLEKAEKENKIVFVDIYTDWCLPCKVMDKEVFEDEATAEFMNENFINYKVNAEKGEGPDINIIYNVKGFPTLLFLDAKGKVIQRNDGSMGIVAFNILAERALESKIQPN